MRRFGASAGCDLGLSARPPRTGRSRTLLRSRGFRWARACLAAASFRPLLCQTSLQRLHQIDHLRRLALGWALRQLAGKPLVDQLFQCGLIVGENFPGSNLRVRLRDDLLHDRGLVLGRGLVGNRREELVGGENLLRKAQGVDEQALPYGRTRRSARACRLRLARSRPCPRRAAHPDHAIPVFGETAVRDEVIGLSTYTGSTASASTNSAISIVSVVSRRSFSRSSGSTVT